MSDLNRKQFEEWFDESGFYKFKETAWAAWQASRECLVIELPEPRAARGYGEQVADALGFNDGINYCEEAIHAAGVKTK